MKKSIFFLAAFFIVAMTAFAVTRMKWICVEDTCERCIINDDTRKCGVCGGFMNSGKDVVKPGGWVQSPYTCNKCGHQTIYKCK